MRLIYNSIIDTQSQLQHATNARPHTKGKNSPFSHPPNSPVKHMETAVSLYKEELRMVWQSEGQGRHGKSKAKFIRMPKEEIHSEDTKAENLVRQPHFKK